MEKNVIFPPRTKHDIFPQIIINKAQDKHTDKSILMISIKFEEKQNFEIRKSAIVYYK